MLKRIVIWTLVAVITLFLALWFYVAVIWMPDFSFGSGTSEERIEAEEWLRAEVDALPCATPQDVRAIAAQRNWLVESHDEFRWCINRDDLTQWMSVTVEPPLFMSTEDENRRYFGFDANGCSADWTYASNC